MQNLTARERQALQLAARGFTVAETGMKLDISKRTVEFYPLSAE